MNEDITVFEQPPPSHGANARGWAAAPAYNFHAPDDPNVDIRAMRAELREMYQQVEKTPWAGLPPGSVQMVMLGDHE